jgi:hypothetical protein
MIATHQGMPSTIVSFKKNVDSLEVIRKGMCKCEQVGLPAYFEFFVPMYKSQYIV